MTSKLRQKRKKIVRERKNVLPALLAMVSLWAILFFIVYLVDPQTQLAIAAFFAVLFLAGFVTFSLVFADQTRAFLLASGVTAFLVLRLFSLGNIINLFLMSGLVISLDLYIKNKRKY